MKGIFKILIILLFVAIGVNMSFAQGTQKFIRDGNKKYQNENYSESEVDYRKAVEANPESQKAQYNLGGALYKQKKFEDAIKQYKELPDDEQDPQKLNSFYYNLGNSYLQSQKLDESIDAYKKALRYYPGDMAAKYNLSYALKLKQQQQQQNQQNQDQKQEPPSEYAKKLKAQADALCDQGKFGEAFGIMNEGLKRDKTVYNYQSFIKKTGEVAQIMAM